MNYEKKYKEALERARHFYNELAACRTKQKVATIFPELAESEDERIRNEIIDYLHLVGKGDGDYAQPMIDRWIAWLGQQECGEKGLKGPQEIGDWRGDENVCKKQKEPLTHLAKALSNFLKNDFEFFASKEWNEAKWNEVMNTQAMELQRLAYLEKQKEQKPAWQEVKGRRGRIGDTPEHIRKKAENFLSKMESPYDADDICSAYETGAMENAKPAEWSEEDEHRRKDAIYFLESAKKHYADTSEIEKTIDWLKSLRPQPKIEWSEKEYGRLFDIEHYLDGTLQLSPDGRIACIDFLKTLRPSWKPGEEQMEALKRASTNEYLSAEQFDILVSLYEHLKKL